MYIVHALRIKSSDNDDIFVAIEGMHMHHIAYSTSISALAALIRLMQMWKRINAVAQQQTTESIEREMENKMQNQSK